MSDIQHVTKGTEWFQCTNDMPERISPLRERSLGMLPGEGSSFSWPGTIAMDFLMDLISATSILVYSTKLPLASENRETAEGST